MNDWAHHATEMIGKAELKRLSARSDAAGLPHLAGHVALLVATGALIYRERPARSGSGRRCSRTASR